MKFQDFPNLIIYFGDASDNIVSKETEGAIIFFEKLKHQLNANSLIFLNQVHGIDGKLLKYGDSIQNLDIGNFDGDLIISNYKGVGIGVLTADCLPIIIFDKVNQVCANIHAGWRGSVQGIILKTLESMSDVFNSNLENLVFYFGPCAKSCCYEVQSNFKKIFFDSTCDIYFTLECFQKRNKKNFFDLPKYNKLQLYKLGVKSNQIRDEYNLCTICNYQFASKRRMGDKYVRQASVALLI